MIVKRYYPGEKIPILGRYWFVVKHGHVIKRVDLKGEFQFPELEDPETYYIAFG